MTPRHQQPLTARQRRHRRLYPLLLALGAALGFAIPVPSAGHPTSTCVAPDCELGVPVIPYERQP